VAVDTSEVTLLAGPFAAPAIAHGAARRIWDAPPWRHLLALALLLVILVPVVGTGSSFSSDEGAAIVQARSLASGEGWIVPHPLPEADPDGDHYPLVLSERGERGFAPFAKHPAYAVLLAGAFRFGGVAAMVLVSVAGVVAAAGLAGALAARFDPVLRRPTIWTVGLATPLFFDGFLVIGHALGAACAAGAVLAAVVAITERRPAMALAVAAWIAGAVLLRTEAALFAGALAAVALIVAVRARPRAPALLVAGAALAAAVVARMFEAAWLVRIVGHAPSAVEIPDRYDAGGIGGYLRDRLDGVYVTWVLPDYKGAQPFSLLLLIMVAALAAAAVEARTGRHGARGVLVPAGLAAVAAMGALITTPAAAVPGLLLACPLLIAGLAVIRRPVVREGGVALALGTVGLFALAVIATQYPTGGGGEWGGRFFALAIPVVVPVLLLALHRHGRAVAPEARRGAVAALVVCSLAVTSMALLTLRSTHQYWSGVIDSLEQAGAVAGPDVPALATWSTAPRYAWPILDRRPWLVTETAGVDRLRRAFADAGVDRFLFVTVDLDADRAALAGLDILWSDGPLEGGRRILVVQESGGP
jgi:hypothetical protein